MPKEITKREKIIFYITVSVMIFSLIFNFFIVPILKKNELLNKEIGLTHAKLKRYLNLLSQKDYIRQKELGFVFDSGPTGTSKDPLIGALAQIENLTRQANIRIVDVRPEAPRQLDIYKEIIINLRTEGNMEGYLKFLYNLDNSLALLKIKKLQLILKPGSNYLEGVFAISQLAANE